MTNSLTQPVYAYTFAVPPEAIDENGHVNNVYYVQWMQDAAVRHYEFIGGVPPMQALGATCLPLLPGMKSKFVPGW